MKTHIAKKPYYIVLKNGKCIAHSKIVLGRNVVTDGDVEWFDDEASYTARLAVVKPAPAPKQN